MTTVSLSLREPAPHGPRVYEDIDLAQLTPSARALAEALSHAALRTRVNVLLRHVDTGEMRGWSGWAFYPHDSTTPAVDYLEQEVAKFPPEWHTYGLYIDKPVPSIDAAARDQYLSRAFAMRALDLAPSEWDALRQARHLPPADRFISNRPQWAVETIEAYRTRPYEKWPLRRVSEYLGHSSLSSTRSQVHRWSVPAVGREPGREGETLYADDQVRAIAAVKPGKGRRGATRSPDGKFSA
ncbi:hypothetical protein ACPCK9_32235 [Streptomyces koyangensis]|uniref:hypothetical protein n=1 Tax=Streptomyces koyangensis TaxID=188770 RepID=UPI003C2BFBD3